MGRLHFALVLCLICFCFCNSQVLAQNKHSRQTGQTEAKFETEQMPVTQTVSQTATTGKDNAGVESPMVGQSLLNGLGAGYPFNLFGLIFPALSSLLNMPMGRNGPASLLLGTPHDTAAEASKVVLILADDDPLHAKYPQLSRSARQSDIGQMLSQSWTEATNQYSQLMQNLQAQGGQTDSLLAQAFPGLSQIGQGTTESNQDLNQLLGQAMPGFLQNSFQALPQINLAQLQALTAQLTNPTQRNGGLVGAAQDTGSTETTAEAAANANAGTGPLLGQSQFQQLFESSPFGQAFTLPNMMNPLQMLSQSPFGSQAQASEITEVRVRPDAPVDVMKETSQEKLDEMKTYATIQEAMQKKTVPILWFRLPANLNVQNENMTTKNLEDLQIEKKLLAFERQVIAELKLLQEIERVAKELRVSTKSKQSVPQKESPYKLTYPLSRTPVHKITREDIEKALSDEYVKTLLQKTAQKQRKMNDKKFTDSAPFKRQTSNEHLTKQLTKDEIISMMAYAYRVARERGEEAPWMLDANKREKESSLYAAFRSNMDDAKQAAERQRQDMQNARQAEAQSAAGLINQFAEQRQWVEEKLRKQQAARQWVEEQQRAEVARQWAEQQNQEKQQWTANQKEQGEMERQWIHQQPIAFSPEQMPVQMDSKNSNDHIMMDQRQMVDQQATEERQKWEQDQNQRKQEAEQMERQSELQNNDEQTMKSLENQPMIAEHAIPEENNENQRQWLTQFQQHQITTNQEPDQRAWLNMPQTQSQMPMMPTQFPQQREWLNAPSTTQMQMNERQWIESQGVKQHNIEQNPDLEKIEQTPTPMTERQMNFDPALHTQQPLNAQKSLSSPEATPQMPENAGKARMKGLFDDFDLFDLGGGKKKKDKENHQPTVINYYYGGGQSGYGGQQSGYARPYASGYGGGYGGGYSGGHGGGYGSGYSGGHSGNYGGHHNYGGYGNRRHHGGSSYGTSYGSSHGSNAYGNGGAYRTAVGTDEIEQMLREDQSFGKLTSSPSKYSTQPEQPTQDTENPATLLQSSIINAANPNTEKSFSTVSSLLPPSSTNVASINQPITPEEQVGSILSLNEMLLRPYMGLKSAESDDDPWLHKPYDLHQPLFTGGGSFEKYLRQRRAIQNRFNSQTKITPEMLDRVLKMKVEFQRKHPEAYKNMLGKARSRTRVAITPPLIQKKQVYRPIELAAAENEPEEDLQHFLKDKVDIENLDIFNFDDNDE